MSSNWPKRRAWFAITSHIASLCTILARSLLTLLFRHLRTETFPELRKIPGFVDASILSRTLATGVEFQIVTRWDSVDAVIKFAGADPEVSVVPPEVVEMMIGRGYSHVFPPKPAPVSTDKPPIIEVRNLTWYDRLKNISLAVRPGEVVLDNGEAVPAELIV